MRILSLRLLLAISLLQLPSSMAAPTSSPGSKAAHPTIDPLSAEGILRYLNDCISWYQHLNSTARSIVTSNSVILENNVQQLSLETVQLAFAFAHAQAAVVDQHDKRIGASDSNTATQSGRNLQKVAAQIATHVDQVTNQINGIQEQLTKTKGRKRAPLEAQLSALQANLTLIQATQKTVNGILSFATEAATDNSGEVENKISILERSLPELSASRSKADDNAKSKNASMPAVNATSPDSAGLLSLMTRLFTIVRTGMQVGSLEKETTVLIKQSDEIKAPVATSIRTAVAQSNSLVEATMKDGDGEGAEAARKQIAQLTTQFKQLSRAITPIGEQSVLLESIQGNFGEWHRLLKDEYHATLRYLLIRFGFLALGIILILAGSETIKRLIFRYVREVRRRRQFLLFRRIIVTLLIALVVALACFTELGFGSLATMAGFITAGLAVALQNVILSGVGYFFLIGRYGIRIGDRVTVSGVTGEVIDIGLVRFYLMEYAGSGTDLHRTGRIVVFSNSVIFQPAAFYKQAPGTDYVWHAVCTTFDSSVEYQSARDRVGQAVRSVYDQYKGRIAKQHAALERSLNLQLPEPHPESRMRFTDAGVEVFVRYPVELTHAPDIDDQIVHTLLEEVEREPKLKVVTAGGPRITQAG